MGQILDGVDLEYYISVLKTLVSQGASLKSVSVAQFNPTGAFEALPLETALSRLPNVSFPEFHVIAEVEHRNPSGLITYGEKYHFWRVTGAGGIKTWIDLEGRVTTYSVRSWGLTDAFGRLVRILSRKP